MKTVELVIIVTVVVLVILIAVYCERKKRIRRVIQLDEPCDDNDSTTCTTCTYVCVPVVPPILEDIQTLFLSFGEGGIPSFNPGSMYAPGAWNYINTDLEPYLIPTTCIVARPTIYSNSPNYVAGTVQLDPSNSNPLGGYIMSTLEDQKNYLLPYGPVSMSSALTQAQVTAGNFFLYGMPADAYDCPVPFYEVDTYAVSEWVDLGATFSITGDELTVTWPAFDVSTCSIGPWEIVVTAQDTVLVCSGYTGSDIDFTYPKMSLGGIVPITATSLVIQLNSAPGGLAHDITLCGAYAFPLCNLSAPTTFFVSSTFGC
jgi:hypothetical protein